MSPRNSVEIPAASLKSWQNFIAIVYIPLWCFLQLLAALTLNGNILYCQLRVLHLRGTSFIHSFIQSTYTRDIINAVLFAVKVHVE